MPKFKLISVKGARRIECSDRLDAIAQAIEYDREFRPAYGVTVEDEHGDTVAEIRDGRNVDADE
jgi:hypothetical protein